MLHFIFKLIFHCFSIIFTAIKKQTCTVVSLILIHPAAIDDDDALPVSISGTYTWWVVRVDRFPSYCETDD